MNTALAIVGRIVIHFLSDENVRHELTRIAGEASKAVVRHIIGRVYHHARSLHTIA
jgi:hypothetical protein